MLHIGDSVCFLHHGICKCFNKLCIATFCPCLVYICSHVDYTVTRSFQEGKVLSTLDRSRKGRCMAREHSSTPMVIPHPLFFFLLLPPLPPSSSSSSTAVLGVDIVLCSCIFSSASSFPCACSGVFSFLRLLSCCRRGCWLTCCPLGEKYEGDWQWGKRHGFGRMLFPDGSRYTGDWVDDR